MKKLIYPITLSVVWLCTAGILFQLNLEENGKIYDYTLRFHVRADSDTPLEQELKIKVRDSVLAYLEDPIENAKNIQQIEQVVFCRLDEIKKIALDTLQKEGKERKITVSLEKERFPVRTYGAISFPAGVYPALRIDIGKAQGHNWWCALYPKLCYVSEEEMELTEEKFEEIRKYLSKKERELFSSPVFSIFKRFTM